MILGAAFLAVSFLALRDAPAQAPPAENFNTVLKLNDRFTREILAGSVFNLTVNVNPASIANPNNPATWPRYIYTDPNPILDDGAGGGIAYTINVLKTGSGVWRMNGQSSTSAGTRNAYTISQGTLELMKDATITVVGGAAANNVFEFAAGTKLNARGSNVITAQSIVLENNMQFGFDLTGYNPANYMLTLDGTINNTSLETGGLNLLAFDNRGPGDVIKLLAYTYTGPAPAQGTNPDYPPPPIRAVAHATNENYNANFSLMVRGESWASVVAASGRLSGTVQQDFNELTTTGGATTINLNSFYARVGEVTWTGTTTNSGGTKNWNATTSNWTGMGNTFLHGDTVTFGDIGSPQVIAVNPNYADIDDNPWGGGGVQIGKDFRRETDNVLVRGMQITGGDYTFQNYTGANGPHPTNDPENLIGIDGEGSVWIHSVSENADDKTRVRFKSANSYWGGTIIDANAEVTLENSAGLGTGQVSLNAGGKLIFDTKLDFDVFYNNITGEGIGEIIKTGANTLQIGGSTDLTPNTSGAEEGIVNTPSDTIVMEGILQKNIGQGVLTIYEGATYRAWDSSRTIAGLSDNLTVDPSTGGTLDLLNHLDPANSQRGLTLTINATRGIHHFSGTIIDRNEAGQGGYGRVIKSGSYDQTFSGQNEYSGGTIISQGKLIGERVLSQDETITPFGYGTVDVWAEGTLQFNIAQAPFTEPVTYVAKFDNKITGAGTVIKSGVLPKGVNSYVDGILCLTSAESDYTGLTDVQEGYLRITHIKATGDTSEVRLYAERTEPDPADPTKERTIAATVLQFKEEIIPGGPVYLDSSVETPYDRAVRGGGNVEVLSDTTIYVSGVNYEERENEDDPLVVKAFSDYTGTTTVYDNANLILTDARGTGKSSAVQLETETSNLTLHFSSDGETLEQEYDRYITGIGNLIKEGSGVAVLTHDPERAIDNDYQGITKVTAGTLKLNYANATGMNSPLVEHRVEIERNAFLELAFDGIYEKYLIGSGALAKSGAGTETILAGHSYYTGGTYLYSGTLTFTDMNSASLGNLGTGDVYFQRGGGILKNTMPVDDLGQNVRIDAGSTATFDTHADMTIGADWHIYHIPSGNEEDEPSHFVKKGPATLTINAETGPTEGRGPEGEVIGWTGSTTVEEGWLVNNIPWNTELFVFQNGGYDTGGKDRQVSAIWGDSDTTGGTVRISGAGTDFIVNYADREKSDTFAGQITGEGNLVLIGNGGYEQYQVEENGEMVTKTVLKPTTLVLTNESNNYKGSTTVQGSYGILIGSIASGTDLIVKTTGTYRSGGSHREIGSLQGDGTVDMQDKTLYITQTREDFDPVYTGVIENGLNLYKNGRGKQTFGGLEYSFRNDVIIAGGTLAVGAVDNLISNFNVGNNLTVASNVMDESGEEVLQTTALKVGRNARIKVGATFDVQGTLDMDLGASGSTEASIPIRAKNVTLGDRSVLNISGIREQEDGVSIVIRSENVIEDDFWQVRVAGQTEVDFLTFNVDKSDDKKDILVGQMLRWYAPEKAHGTFTLENPEGSFTVGKSLIDITDARKREPYWTGTTLTKRGPGTLILAAENTYSGATTVEGGTLKLTNEKATGGSSGILLAGGDLEIDFESRNADGTWSPGMTTPIDGAGGVRKTGRTYSVLAGDHTYKHRTDVLLGALLVDGSIQSNVLVASGAGFGGNGTVDRSVTFDDNSFYVWRFGATEADSDMLHVTGDVLVGNNVLFRALTNTMEEKPVDYIDGWKVLKYEGVLSNHFAGIDSSSNPFYQFELDYSLPGYVRIGASQLDAPRPLSDIGATSLLMAQTKMYRTAFQQIAREWSADCPITLQRLRNQERQNGQAPGMYRTAWANFVGRGDHFASSYFDRKFSFQSYGVQAGVSLFSSCDRTFGLMFGREEGKLSNHSDKVEGEDYYLGFYFGRHLPNRFDIMAYIGGGWQKNDLTRYGNGRGYGARFSGNTFNFDFEIGRRFWTTSGSILRPFFGFDVEIARLGGAEEKVLEGMYSNEYRHYKSSDLNRVFFKVGVEGNQSWRMLDFHARANLNWNLADDCPKMTIYYPYIDGSVDGFGADLGVFTCELSVGMNWYLTERRNTMFFINYIADVYLDRTGDPYGGGGTVGLSWRF